MPSKFHSTALAKALGLGPDNLSSVGLTLPANLPFAKWSALLCQIDGIHGSAQWWLGDALLHADKQLHGEKYKQAVDAGFDYKTAANAKRVAKSFEISRRRENLRWGHHEAAAGIAPADADRLLKQAEREGWSIKRLRIEVKALKYKGDPIRDIPVVPTAKVGDRFLLGEHRLMCGDSTREDDVARLWGDGPEFRMIWTDPPYGVGYGKKTRAAKGAFRPRVDIQGDDDGEEAASLFRKALLAAIPHAMSGAALYATAPSGNNLPLFIGAMNDGGFRFKDSLVWVKSSFVMGRADYHHRYEPILYGWKSGAHFFTEDRTKDDVFEVDRPAASDLHPTMKPVELIVQMVENSTEEHGEIVYDPFCGSGSTILAAERLGRRCYAMEIEPAYVDVAIARWEKETRKKAVLEDTTVQEAA